MTPLTSAVSLIIYPLVWTTIALQYFVNHRRVELDEDFCSLKSGCKNKLRNRYSNELNTKGYHYTSQQCEGRFRSLKTHFTKVHNKSKCSGSGKITWPHYTLMARVMRDMGKK